MLSALAFTLSCAVSSAPEPVLLQDPDPKHVRYIVRGKSPRRVRRLTSSSSRFVQGVPAEPVDSFCYDGNGVEDVEGFVLIDVDPVKNTGKVISRWKDEHGLWDLEVQLFTAPHHPSGLRVSPDANVNKLFYEDPIVTDLYLHGNSTAGMPVLPTVHTKLAAWGQAAVRLNGAPFDNPFDGPFPPLWELHLMVTEGVRGPDGTVRAEDGSIYNPMMHAASGRVDPQDLEIHLTFHDAPYPENTANFPPIFDFFYHVVFDDVTMRLKNEHVDGDQ